MRDLIERLEGLDGPTTEIMREVYEACYPSGGTRWASDKCHEERYQFLVHREVWLEAAAMLVPEGREWLRKSFTSMTIVIDDPNEKTWARHVDGVHKSPAIALCIAALKATP